MKNSSLFKRILSLILALSMLVTVLSHTLTVDTDASSAVTAIESFDDDQRFAVDTGNKKEGSGSATQTVAVNPGVNAVTNTEAFYAQPIDLSVYRADAANAYVHLWLYVDYAYLVNNRVDGRIQFSSGGAWFTNMEQADLTNYNLKDGWNELFIPLTAFSNAGVGECDWSSINYARVYLQHQVPAGGAVSQTVKLDDLSIGFKASFDIPVASTLLQLESYDKGPLYPVDTAVKQEGSGSATATVSASTAGAALIDLASHYMQTKDLSAYKADAENAYVHLWLYVEHAALVNNLAETRIQIGSGNGWGGPLAYADLNKYVLKDGWNELFIPLSDFTEVGACDWAHINYLRVYMFHQAPVAGPYEQTMKLDDLSIGFASDFDIPAASTLLQLESYDKSLFLPIDTANKQEGAGSASATVSANTTAAALIDLASYYTQTKNLSAYKADAENAYIHLWLYVEYAALVNNQQAARIQIGSGVDWQGPLAEAELNKYTLKDGWNELFIPLSVFAEVGTVDWANIRYLRVYMFHLAPVGGPYEQTMKIDDLSIGFTSDFDIPAASTLLQLESYDKGPYFPVDTASKQEGTGSASATVTVPAGGTNLTDLASHYCQTKDLSAYQADAENAYVHLWLYIEDADTFNNQTDGRIQIGSGNGWGGSLAYADITDYELINGWNELFIPLSSFQTVGECDWAHINYLRVYLQHHNRWTGDRTQTVKLDDLSIGFKSDFTIPAASTLKQLESFDDARKFTVDTENKQEGTGAATVATFGTGALVTGVEAFFVQTKNLSAYRNNDQAYVHLWLYLEDASCFDNGRDAVFEMGSAGGWWDQVAQYDLTKQELKDGWNELFLPVSKFTDHPSGTMASCNWSKINYARLYIHNAAWAEGQVSQTMKLDDMSIGLVTDFEIPGTETRRVIETFDSGKFYPVDTEKKKEGVGAADLQVAGTENVIAQVESFFVQKKNLSAYAGREDVYVHFWLYVEDTALVNRDIDSFLEFGSAGGWWDETVHFDLSALELQSGWNELFVPMSEFVAHADMNPINWEKVNYLRLYVHSRNTDGGQLSQTVKVDGMEIGLAQDFTLPQQDTVTMVESYDAYHKFHVDTQEKKEGIGSASVTATGTGDVAAIVEAIYPKAKDLSFYGKNENAYVHFWLYVEDTALINRDIDSFLEFGSAGGWWDEVVHYDLSTLTLKNGWNEVMIPVSSFEASADMQSVNWEKINYLRLYIHSRNAEGGTLTQTIRVDGMEMGLASDFTLPEKTTLTMVESYDAYHKFHVDTQEKKEGSGAASVTAEGSGDVLSDIEAGYLKAKDLSFYAEQEDAYVHFWLYVEDASLINREMDGYMEFSSGGGWFAEAARFDVTMLDLQDGWNEVMLPVSAFERSLDPEVAECDWSRVNYIRLYFFSTAKNGGKLKQTVRIDGLELGMKTDFPNTKPVGLYQREGTLFQLESYDNASKYTVSTDAKEGEHSARVSASGRGSVVTEVVTTFQKPKDLSYYADSSKGVVHLWVYIEDAGLIDRTMDSYMEFSSEGGWDAGVARYDVAGLNWHNGWNEVMLPLSSFGRSSDPEVSAIDWTKVNYFRFYLHSTAKNGGKITPKLGLDDLSVGLRSDFPDAAPTGKYWPPVGKLLLESYDNTVRFMVDGKEYKEGSGSASAQASGEGAVLNQIAVRYNRGQDLSRYAKDPEGYVNFWLYVEDASLIDRSRDAYMEFSSGGDWTSGLARYGIGALELVDGWNEVYIPLSAFRRSLDPKVSAINWSSVNYIRLYMFSSDPAGGQIQQTIRMDGLYLGTKADFDIPEKTDTLFMIESYEDPRLFTVDGEDFKEGFGSATVQTTAAGESVLQVESFYHHRPIDLSYYRTNPDTYISFWLYLSDVDVFNREVDAMLEFSSEGGWYAGVDRYNLTLLDLKDGWNQIVIPTEHFFPSPDEKVTPCDWSDINYIRFYMYAVVPGGSDPAVMKVDGLCAGLASDFVIEEPEVEINMPVQPDNQLPENNPGLPTPDKDTDPNGIGDGLIVACYVGGAVLLLAAVLVLLILRKKKSA